MPRPRRWHGSRCASVPEQRDRWGLLVPVATVSSRRTAAHLSGLLADYAIRCTVVPAITAASTGSTEGERWDVVVFPEDGAAAHRVLSTMLPER